MITQLRQLTPKNRYKNGCRGVSLLEVVIVAAVGSVLFLILLRWVFTLTSVSTITVDNATAARNAGYIEARLGADLATATSCDGVGGPPISYLNDSTLDVFVQGIRQDNTTGLKIIRWTLNGNELIRAETDLADDGTECASAGSIVGTGDHKIISTGVTGNQIFSSATNGVENTEGCTTVNGTPTGAGCNPSTVKVAATVSSLAPETAPVRISRTYNITNVGGGL